MRTKPDTHECLRSVSLGVSLVYVSETRALALDYQSMLKSHWEIGKFTSTTITEPESNSNIL